MEKDHRDDNGVPLLERAPLLIGQITNNRAG
jgi:hypothetical protein